jgi:hypothetical protein
MNQGSNFWVQFVFSKLTIILPFLLGRLLDYMTPILRSVGISVDAATFIPKATAGIIVVAGIIWSALIHQAALMKDPSVLPSTTPTTPVYRAPMKPLAIILLLSLIGMSPLMTACATTTNPSAETTAQKVQNGLLTASHLIQQGNTGIQTVAPTADTVLTAAKAQGDVALVNEIQNDSAVFAPLLEAMLNGIAASIPVAQTPAAQIAAVNTATSPTTIAAIVAPVAAATPN